MLKIILKCNGEYCNKKKPEDYIVATGKTYTVKHFINVAGKILNLDIKWSGSGLNEVGYLLRNNKKKMDIYADKKTLAYLKKSFSYSFENTPEYPAIVKANKLKKIFSLGNGNELIKFKSIEVKHGKINSIGYIFNNSAYIADCNQLSSSNIANLKNLKYFIIDCLQFKPHPSHFSFNEVLSILNEIKPKRTILTNLHSNLDYNILLKKVPINVKPAFDGLKIQL